jgi:hypothetical protein
MLAVSCGWHEEGIQGKDENQGWLHYVGEGAMHC